MLRLLPRSPVVFGLFVGAAYFIFSRPRPSCAQNAGVAKSPSVPRITIVGMFEEGDEHMIDIFNNTLKEGTTEVPANFNFVPIKVLHNDEYPAYMQICTELLTGVSLIADVTWEGWVHGQSLASSADVPYIRIDVTNSNFINALEKYLRLMEATNAAIIFANEKRLDQALIPLVGNTVVRIIVVDGSKDDSMKKLASRRPAPTYIVFVGSSEELRVLIDKATKLNMIYEESRAIIVQEDSKEFDVSKVVGYVSILRPTVNLCCDVEGVVPISDSSCQCKPNEKYVIEERFLVNAVKTIKQNFGQLIRDRLVVTGVITNCSNNTLSTPDPTTSYHRDFINLYQQAVGSRQGYLNSVTHQWNSKIEVKYQNDSILHLVATYTPNKEYDKDKLNVIETFQKKYFKIGTAWEVPFLYNKTDENGNYILDDKGHIELGGFCIDLLIKLAGQMKFTYKLHIRTKSELGDRMANGSWDGLMGELIAGDIDIIIAPLVITSEREEVVDFVAPYFEQSGISIVMKKPEKQTSLFKFMSVLKDEVWWCILGALVVTSIVLWVVDKFSPYSGRNKKLYPYKCREFTLAECFWFSLTSMTPQGGGEPPKAVSGRILVAAYWIFVVLMLATFTANLAAFLTVERMQTPVQSLEELAKQSKINYSVVQGSSTFQFFNNMANAENELYRIWKDLTLNATGADQARYRVWDYPIKEQYGRILNVIELAGLIVNESEGFKMANEKNDFAFIHDALRIKYEVYNNCNLTEIGEPFAEQPYAIAVQSGSHLQEEIGKVLLEFQKDRYFETLSQEYWNSSLRRRCKNDEEAEGITLDSIGGVFIMTLVGLVIGMITLIGEIIIYKRNKESKVVSIKVRQKKSMAGMK